MREEPSRCCVSGVIKKGLMSWHKTRQALNRIGSVVSAERWDRQTGDVVLAEIHRLHTCKTPMLEEGEFLWMNECVD